MKTVRLAWSFSVFFHDAFRSAKSKVVLGTNIMWGLGTGANFISKVFKMADYFNKVLAVHFRSSNRENRYFCSPKRKRIDISIENKDLTLERYFLIGNPQFALMFLFAQAPLQQTRYIKYVISKITTIIID